MWVLNALPGLSLIALCLWPPAHRALRALSAPWLEATVRRQLPVVLAVQEWRCGALDAVARAVAGTVAVEVYLVCLPLMFLLGWEDEACYLASALALTTHVASAVKDIMCGPRPGHVLTAKHGAEKDVALRVMEASREIEFGCPSMHVALVVVMNGAAVHLFLGPDSLPEALLPAREALRALALLWVALIAWSRLYLGVHSPVDLAFGGLVGGALLGMWVALGGAWLAAVKAVPWAFGAHAVGCAALLLTYPRPPVHTSSYTYTVIFCGAQLGIAGGVSAAFAASALPAIIRTVLAAAPPGALRAMASLAGGATPAWLAARLMGGIALVLATRSVTKALLVAGLPPLLACAPARLRAAWQPPVSVDYSSIGQWVQQQHSRGARKGPAAKGGAQGQQQGQGGAQGGGGAKGGGGVLLKPDGYPWDCDLARRLASYAAAVAILVVYVRTLQAAARVVV